MTRLIAALLVSLICATAYADVKTIPIKFKRTGDIPIEGTYERYPMGPLPIDVEYDDEARTVTVSTTDPELDAWVYIFNNEGYVVDAAPCVNCELIIGPTHQGPYEILIEADTWEATATFY